MTELQNIILDELHKSTHPEILKVLLRGYRPGWITIPHTICMSLEIEGLPAYWLCVEGFSPNISIDKLPKELDPEITYGRLWLDEDATEHHLAEYAALLGYKKEIRELARRFSKKVNVIKTT